MKSEITKNFSLLIIIIGFIAFIYISAKAFAIVQKTQISTSDGIYTNRVTTSEEIKAKAFELTKKCQSELCEVQSVLDYVTHIPYKINHFQAHSPQRTIQLGFGDCDDKSNLLISMLHALNKEAYFVLVPKHIFVITTIEDKRLGVTKGLWIDGKKYFVLESTAKGSAVGFPLHYKLDKINVIVDPFTNEKYSFKQIEWK
jgi:transglutaminase-like putative cysteine protease